MAKKNKKSNPDVYVDKKLIAQLKKEKKAIAKQRKKNEKKALKEQQKADAELRKREEYKLIQSTQMSVPITDVLRGVIVTKDNRYLKIMEYSPQNFLMLSASDKNKVIDSFKAMLKVVPNKIHFKTFACKAKTETLLKTMRECHEIEENDLCRRMQEEYIDLIENTALREGVTRRFFVIIEYMDDVATDGTDFRAIAGSLNQTAARIRSYMEAAGNKFIDTCETDQGVTEFLYEVLNRKAAETEPFAKRVYMVYDHYISEMKEKGNDSPPPIPATEFIAPAWIDYEHSHHMVIDEKFYTFGYITEKSFPNYVQAGWLSGFINACEGVDLDIFLSREPTEKVANDIGRRIRNNQAKFNETSETTLEARDVASSIASGNYLLNGLSSGEEFFYVNVLITVTGDSLKDVNYRFNELRKMGQSMGIDIRRTSFEMEKAFESTLPLCKIDSSLKRKSRRNVLSSGAASFYPFVSYELQDPNGIMLGVDSSNNSLVAVDVFDTDRHANANGAILGKSGYGKTFTAQLIAMRLRLQNIQTFIITPLKGREDYKRACEQIDGQYISLGPGSPFSINIFDIRVPDTAGLIELDGYDDTTSLLAKKVQDLHTFMHLAIKDITQEEEQVLDGYIYRVYERYGITEDNNSIFEEGTKNYKKFPLLGDLHEEIKNEPVLRRVYNILMPMISGSLSVYNKPTNVDLDNKYIVFDMNGIKGQNLALSMFIVTDFVWSRVKENRLIKKAVFLDEGWALIGSESNEMTAEYVKEIFKTIRAFGGAAFIMTQDISDFFALKNGEYGKAIISNSDTKICLHLDESEAQVLSTKMTMSVDEYKKIVKLERGKGLLVTGNNRLFVDFKASEFEKEVITTDPKYLRKKMQELNIQKETSYASFLEHFENN